MSDFVPQAMGNAIVAISTTSPPRVGTANFDDHESSTPRAVIPLPVATADCSDTATAEANSAAPSGSRSTSGRKPRGRPPGSKNKPKPPVVITQECDSAMQPTVLEVIPGTDVAAALADFAQRRGVCLSVLGGSGVVTNVVLRYPSVHSTSTVALSGRFDILSLTGTFILPPPSKSGGAAPAATAKAITDLTLSLAGPQGQVIGGIVVGPLAAAGPVAIVAATFSSPEYHRLPLSEEATPAAVKEEEDLNVMQVAEPPAGNGGPSSLAGQPSPRPEMMLWTQQSTIRATPPPQAVGARRQPRC